MCSVVYLFWGDFGVCCCVDWTLLLIVLFCYALVFVIGFIVVFNVF